MGLILFNNLGQNTLEITLVIIIGIMLILGAISTWNWFNKAITERLDNYKSTRHIAATTNFGQQLNYTPDKFDIFCATSSTLGTAPGMQIPDLPDDPELQHCYEEFNATMNASQILMNESITAQIDAAELMGQFVELKGELGNFTVYHLPVFNGDKFDGWLFWPDPDRYEIFYTSSWDNVGEQFSLRAPGYFFRTESGIPVTASFITQNYINVGINLEDTAQAKAQESAQKWQTSQELAQNATTQLILCTGGELPPSDPCLDQCQQDYGDEAQQLFQEANIYCMGGMLELCNQTMTQAQELQEQYFDCTAGCN